MLPIYIIKNHPERSTYHGFKDKPFKNPILHFMFDTHYIFGSIFMIVLILFIIFILSNFL
jgi:hypothetical protein